jgi:hypothetical protein
MVGFPAARLWPGLVPTPGPARRAGGRSAPTARRRLSGSTGGLADSVRPRALRVCQAGPPAQLEAVLSVCEQPEPGSARARGPQATGPGHAASLSDPPFVTRSAGPGPPGPGPAGAIPSRTRHVMIMVPLSDRIRLGEPGPGPGAILISGSWRHLRARGPGPFRVGLAISCSWCHSSDSDRIRARVPPGPGPSWRHHRVSVTAIITVPVPRDPAIPWRLGSWAAAR